MFQQNINPETNDKLTPRNNPHSVRFYDFQCSAQKSVSVMSLFDPRLVEAHRNAVEIGMEEMQKFAAVRIRTGDNCATRNFAYTGQFVYAQYHHDNSRLLDPQLHTYHYLNPRYCYNSREALLNAYRFFGILGIKGCNQESSETWGGLDGFLLYEGGRLAWNPWFDEQALKKDYFDKLYGAAGQFMIRYNDILEAALLSKTNKLRMGLSQYAAVPIEELAEMDKLLTMAAQAVTGDPRATKAVEFQAGYQQFLKAFSHTMRAGDRYYHSTTQENHRALLEAIGELREATKPLVAKRIVSFYIQRVYDAWESRLKADHDANQALNNVLQTYRQLNTITAAWRFKTDPDSVGDREQWFAKDFNDSTWGKIKSGGFWEDQGYPDYDGAAWYRIDINIPSGKPAALYFGGADERAWVHLDGNYIGGHHEGDVGILWNEPFVIDIPAGTTPGKHQLTVKVIDSAGKGGLWKDVLILQQK